MNDDKSVRNLELEEFIKLYKSYESALDEEMEHGDYHAPDCPPPQYDDEEDYYGHHEEIVAKVCDALESLREFINNYEKRTGKEVL